MKKYIYSYINVKKTVIMKNLCIQKFIQVKKKLNKKIETKNLKQKI